MGLGQRVILEEVAGLKTAAYIEWAGRGGISERKMERIRCILADTNPLSLTIIQ